MLVAAPNELRHRTREIRQVIATTAPAWLPAGTVVVSGCRSLQRGHVVRHPNNALTVRPRIELLSAAAQKRLRCGDDHLVDTGRTERRSSCRCGAGTAMTSIRSNSGHANPRRVASVSATIGRQQHATHAHRGRIDVLYWRLRGRPVTAARRCPERLVGRAAGWSRTWGRRCGIWRVCSRIRMYTDRCSASGARPYADPV